MGREQKDYLHKVIKQNSPSAPVSNPTRAFPLPEKKDKAN